MIDSSKLKIESAFEDGLITEAQMTQMMREVEQSFAFNPVITTTYEEILFSVKKGVLFFKTCSTIPFKKNTVIGSFVKGLSWYYTSSHKD